MENFSSLRDKYTCSCDESVMYDKFLLPEKARGMWVWCDGVEKPFLDLVLGYSSVNFGHCYPAIVEAVQESSKKIAQIHSFHTKQKLLLSQYLANKVSQKQDFKVYFDVGGSSLVESAIRICRQFTKKRYVVNFEGAYHGATYLAASVTDDRFLNKAQYGIDNISEYIIRLPFPAISSDITTDKCIKALDSICRNKDVAAVIVEPVQGANGFVFPKDDFFPELRKMTKFHSVELIVDEIQTGVGRTGMFFAYQNWDIVPDVVLLSKSLAGGYYPLGAVIAKSTLFNCVSSQSTAFQSTFNNNPLGINIALKVIDIIESENVLKNVKEKGKVLLNKLSFLKDKPYISHLRGEGLAIAWNIIEPDTLHPSKELAKKLVDIALDNFVIIYACGINGNVIKIAPSLLITDEETTIILDKLKAIINQFDTINIVE